MLRLILGILNTILWLYDVLVLVWAIISIVKPASNQWTEMVRRLVEPVLAPIRKFLTAKLPQNWQVIDWSPLGLWIISGLLQRFITLLRG